MSIIVKRGNVTIKNYVQTGATLTQNYHAPVYIGAEESHQEEKEDEISLEPANVRKAIDLLMSSNARKNKRWWFAIYVVLRDQHAVSDLGGFEAYVSELYQGVLPVPIDTHDLSKEVEVGCFTKNFNEWTPDMAPVGGASYERYKNLVTTFIEFLQDS